ncbi:MAG: heme-binding protein [Candidatus Eisenbacteria bacterium]|uniref:Heme-binding protein n=1 Tax=Eiseniibacteriota bacterium TaxID=2212470 RepID=A0A849SS95_UNCEI|nr:heme-binding protein [Candidatus Eisenbacteria bacterium]
MAALPASAQTTTKKILTLEGARSVAASAEAEARRVNAGGAIAIVDDGGQLLLLVRLDNTFPAAAAVAAEKARTAAQFRRPTQVFEDAIKGGRLSLLGVSVITPLQGGVPIMVDGELVGAIGVSGAMSAQQDTDIANVAAVALQKMSVKP